MLCSPAIRVRVRARVRVRKVVYVEVFYDSVNDKVVDNIDFKKLLHSKLFHRNTCMCAC